MQRIYRTKKEIVFDYDSLVISTGARAVIPPQIIELYNGKVNAMEEEGLFLLRNFEDGIHIRDYIRNAKSVLVIIINIIITIMILKGITTSYNDYLN